MMFFVDLLEYNFRERCSSERQMARCVLLDSNALISMSASESAVISISPLTQRARAWPRLGCVYTRPSRLGASSCKSVQLKSIKKVFLAL